MIQRLKDIHCLFDLFIIELKIQLNKFLLPIIGIICKYFIGNYSFKIIRKAIEDFKDLMIKKEKRGTIVFILKFNSLFN